MKRPADDPPPDPVGTAQADSTWARIRAAATVKLRPSSEDTWEQAMPAALDAATKRHGAGATPGPTPAEASAAAHDLGTVGHYELRQEHARGGSARVLVAFDHHVGREVAWKELLTSAGGEGLPREERERRFLREARVTAQLEHPHIVPVHEIGQRDDGTHYYTMRFVRGETLADKLWACRRLEDRLRLLGPFWDVCRAVAFAHQRGVIHRDIKPANCMVGELGETVLLDWGIARVCDQGEERADATAPRTPTLTGGALETTAGTMLGTPAYMSPEQAAGDPAAVDRRSDVWGLGALLYEILTGGPPFDGPNAAYVVELVLKRPVPPVRARCAAAPPELAAVAEKALARAREERYPDAGALLEDVSAYMTGGRVRAFAYRPWDLMRRLAARHRAAVVAAAAVLVTVVAALFAVSLALRRETAARVREREEHLTAELHLAQAHTQRAQHLLAQGALLSAEVHALASLGSNPGFAGSSAHDPAFAARNPSSDTARLDALSALYRSRLRLVRGLAGAFPVEDAARNVAMAPDGRTFAAVDGGGWLRVWDAASLRLLARPRAHEGGAYAAAFSPDGSVVATGGRDGSVKLFPVGAEAPTRTFAVGHPVRAVAFSPDGQRLATGDIGNQVRLWEVASGRPLATLAPHGAQVRGLAFSADGRWLASGSWDTTARIWDARTLALKATLRGHTDTINKLAFSPDGELLATAASDRTVRVWTVATGMLRATLMAGRAAAHDVGFLPDGETVIIGSGDRMLRQLHVPSGQLRLAVEAHRDTVFALALSRDGRRLVTGGLDSVVKLWDLEASDGLLHAWHPPVVYGVAQLRDGTRLATTAWDGFVRLWDTNRGNAITRIADPGKNVNEVVFAPDGSWVASAGQDGVVRIWSFPAGQLLRELRGHDGEIRAMSVSADGTRLATAGRDKRARLWDVATGRELAALPHGEELSAVAFGHDARWLYTTAWDRELRRWPVTPPFTPTRLFRAPDRLVWLAVGANGENLATSCASGEVFVLGHEPGAPVRTFRSHQGWATGVALSPDGRLLATGGQDGFIVLWDLATRRRLLRLDAGRAVTNLSFTLDGRALLVAAGEDLIGYPVQLPDPGRDVLGARRAAERASGMRLDGAQLEVAPVRAD
jgi:WD40 repeat protein/serine/threonine protein kinase